jgi:hypothetical protein
MLLSFQQSRQSICPQFTLSSFLPLCACSHAVFSRPQLLQIFATCNQHETNNLALGIPPACTPIAARQRRSSNMPHTSSASPNQIQNNLVPMIRVWTRSIGWTVLLSTLFAVLFALALDGCSGLH